MEATFKSDYRVRNSSFHTQTHSHTLIRLILPCCQYYQITRVSLLPLLLGLPCVFMYVFVYVMFHADEPKQAAVSSGGFQGDFQRTRFHTCFRRFWETGVWRTKLCGESHMYSHKLPQSFIKSYSHCFYSSVQCNTVSCTLVKTELS